MSAEKKWTSMEERCLFYYLFILCTYNWCYFHQHINAI